MNWGLLFVLLLVLACPLIMWSMMKDRSGHAGRGEAGAVSKGREAELPREIEVLRARIADLERGESGRGTGRDRS